MVNRLVEDVLQHEEHDEADQRGDDRRGDPTRGDATQGLPADTLTAMQQANPHHRAHHRLRTGHRDQRDGRQALTGEEMLQGDGGEEEEDDRLGDDHHPGRHRGQGHQAIADHHHHPLGIGEDPHRDGDGPHQEELLHGGDGDAADRKVGKGGGTDEDPHDVTDVVGPQGVGTEGAGQDQPDAGIRVQAQQVQLGAGQDPHRQLVQQGAEDPGQDRTGDPGGHDRRQGGQVRDGAAEPVPADDGPHHGVGGRDRQPGQRHPVDGQGRGEGGHEGPGQGIEGAQFAQAMGRARSAEDRAQDDENATDQGRRREADHAAADGGAKDVGGVVRPE